LALGFAASSSVDEEEEAESEELGVSVVVTTGMLRWVECGSGSVGGCNVKKREESINFCGGRYRRPTLAL